MTQATITNYSTLIFLINPKVRAIKAVYEPVRGKYNSDGGNVSDVDGKPIKATIFKTFDETICVDDYIIVPTETRHKMTICKVVELDVQVELDTTAQIEWVMGVVSTADHDELKRMEDAAITRVKSAKANAAREELRKQLLADVGNIDMGALQIAHMGEAPAPAPETPPHAGDIDPDMPKF